MDGIDVVEFFFPGLRLSGKGHKLETKSGIPSEIVQSQPSQQQPFLQRPHGNDPLLSHRLHDTRMIGRKILNTFIIICL